MLFYFRESFDHSDLGVGDRGGYSGRTWGCSDTYWPLGIDPALVVGLDWYRSWNRFSRFKFDEVVGISLKNDEISNCFGVMLIGSCKHDSDNLEIWCSNYRFSFGNNVHLEWCWTGRFDLFYYNKIAQGSIQSCFFRFHCPFFKLLSRFEVVGVHRWTPHVMDCLPC